MTAPVTTCPAWCAEHNVEDGGRLVLHRAEVGIVPMDDERRDADTAPASASFALLYYEAAGETEHDAIELDVSGKSGFSGVAWMTEEQTEELIGVLQAALEVKRARR